jgi:hypothetical protein
LFGGAGDLKEAGAEEVDHATMGRVAELAIHRQAEHVAVEPPRPVEVDGTKQDTAGEHLHPAMMLRVQAICRYRPRPRMTTARTLEAVLIVDGTRSRRESTSKLIDAGRNHRCHLPNACHGTRPSEALTRSNRANSLMQGATHSATGRARVCR